MKLENTYLLVLGFIIYLHNVFCSLRTCGTEFDNVQSRVYLSAVVFEGKAEAIESEPTTSPLESSAGGSHRVTFRVTQVIKGRLSSNSVVVGNFGKAKNDKCLPVVTTGRKYIVFLNDSSAISAGETTTGEREYRVSAHPVIASKKNTRQARTMCDGCEKPPKVRTLNAPAEIKQNSRLTLKCRVQGMPPPTIVWAKDGQILSRSKRVSIRTGSDSKANESIEIINDRKGSRLRIKKVSVADAGSYECQVSNVIGWDKKEINITVTGTHYEKCGERMKYYCLNGGSCYFSKALKAEFCQCPTHYVGSRCEYKELWEILRKINNEDKRAADRSITITAIVIGVLVLLALCTTAYIMARKRRTEFLQRRKRREQKIQANATYTKYPLNVVDDVKPYTVSRMTQTNTHDYEDTSLFTSAPEQHTRNQPFTFSTFPLAQRQAVLAAVSPSSPPPRHPFVKPVKRFIQQAEPKSSPLPYIENSALVNAIVESDQDNTLKTSNSYIGDSSSLPCKHGYDKNTKEESPNNKETEPFIINKPPRMNGSADVNGIGPSEQRFDENVANNNSSRNYSPNYLSDYSGDSNIDDDSSDDGDAEEALLRQNNHNSKTQDPASLLHPTAATNDCDSVGNLSWDEYGNALPSYPSESFAFNPYVLDDDILGNNCLSPPVQNGTTVSLLSRLEDVKENQDPTPV